MTVVTDRRLGLSSSLAVKAPCRVASTENLTLWGYQEIDGVLPTSADSVADRRILCKDQTNAVDNGIRIMDDGPWERARDFDGNNDFLNGTRVFVREGDIGQAEYRVSSTLSPTFSVDTDDITFEVVDAPMVASFVIDGGGGAIGTGEVGYLPLGVVGEISSWKIVANAVGSVVIDVWKVPFASIPATIANTITGSAQPTLSSQRSASSSTLTGWTTTFTEDDWLAFYVVSASGISRLTVSLFGNRQ